MFICLQTVSVELAEVKQRQSLIKIQAGSDRDQISFFYCENQLLRSHRSVNILLRIADRKVLFVVASQDEKDKVEQNT